MEKIKNLKPFDLEAAKAGKPVRTKDGRDVRIICFDCKDETFPIVALVSPSSVREEVISYDEAGYSTTREPDDILVMIPEKKEGWINIYHDKEDNIYTDENVFHSEYDAIKLCSHDGCKVDTVKIEWEE